MKVNLHFLLLSLLIAIINDSRRGPILQQGNGIISFIVSLILKRLHVIR